MTLTLPVLFLVVFLVTLWAKKAKFGSALFGLICGLFIAGGAIGAYAKSSSTSILRTIVDGISNLAG